MKTSHRLATSNDLDFIYQSLKDYVKEGGVAHRFKHTQDSLKAALFSQHPIAEVLIAEQNGQPVGFALFSNTQRNFPLFNGPGLYLHDFYVLPDYRHQGIGTEFFNQIRNIAKERKCDRLDWVVLKDNDAGKEFYKTIPDAQEVDYIHYMRVKL